MTNLLYPIAFLLCHFIGDFWLQSDWMALEKNKKSWNCFIHVIIYTACFMVLTLSWKALLFIGATHFILDRWHFLINRTIWAKNHYPDGYPPYEYCSTTGYYDDSPVNKKKPDDDILLYWGKPRPFFITIWLRIVCDNTLHLLCNLIAITLLA